MSTDRSTLAHTAADRYRGFVLAVIALAGLGMAVAGSWAMAAPQSFADAVAFPANVHFVHDAGAFQAGIGATLLLALYWRDAPALALAGFLVANTLHAVNHAVDADLGGHGWEPYALAAGSLLTGAALVLRLRQLGYVIGEVGSAATPALARFVRQKTVLLTTYRRDGTPVGSPVSLAVDGDRGYFRTWHTAGKAKRLRNNPEVTVTPSTMRGRPTGPALAGHATLLDGAEARRAARMLSRRQPLLHGVLVPVSHRLMRVRTLHYALTPRPGAIAQTAHAAQTAQPAQTGRAAQTGRDPRVG
jgi:PPOX class probable F420-dependent enzyme